VFKNCKIILKLLLYMYCNDEKEGVSFYMVGISVKECVRAWFQCAFLVAVVMGFKHKQLMIEI